MKRFAALMLVFALVLGCNAAMAELPITATGQSGAYAWYKGDWTPNFDGTHSHSGRTVPCEVFTVTYEGVTITACPVCGDINGEKVPLCESRYLQFNRHYDVVKAAKVGMDPASQICGNCVKTYEDGSADGCGRDGVVRNYKYLTNGEYMVRIMKMPAESPIAYVVTTCHEIGGVFYEAECTYSYMLPLDGTGLTVKKAYFGSARDIKCETKVTNQGFYFKPYARENAFGLFLLVK